MKLQIIFLIAGILLSEITFSQQSYPLVCRGGGRMHFNYTPFSNFSTEPQIWIHFRKGSQSAGHNWENIGALMPGECSWLDRTVNHNEPERIIIKHVRDFSIQWQQGQVTGISSALSYINTLQESNRFQTFDVYNDRNGNFIVTNIGSSR